MAVLPQSFGTANRKMVLGARVDRATDTLPAGTDGALFTITTGRVLITSIVGEVTTAIQNQACNTKLKFNPTAAGADTDLCTVLDIADDAVGTLYTITGDFSDAMVAATGGPHLERPIVLSEGDIELETAATNTGSVAWTLTYVPLDDGATIAAA